MSILGIALPLFALATAALLPAMSPSRSDSPRSTSTTPHADDDNSSNHDQPKIAPCLWFQKDAEDALRFYTGVFAGAKVMREVRWADGGPLPKGTLMVASLRVAGQDLTVLNGNPAPQFTDAISLSISCDTQAEIDTYWEKLTANGGKPGPCGWLKDRFGVSWQVVPAQLGTWLGDKDPEKAKRVGAALMQMGKLDMQRLQQAFDGR